MAEHSKCKTALLCRLVLGAITMLVVGRSEAKTPQMVTDTAGSSEERNTNVDQMVQPFFQNGCHVGLSIAIVRGKDSRFYSFGSTSREKHIMPGPDNIYEIASVTKTFTGALAAEALQQSRMQLDADFRQYLPQQYPNLAWQGKPITLRNLAGHTSGLPRDLPNTDDLFAHRNPETLPYKLIARDSHYGRDRYLRELHSIKLHNEPGTSENYSNLGFKVIGWGLESAYGAPFEQLMQQMILTPLRMKSTSFALSAHDSKRLVIGYSPAGHRMPYHLRNAGAAYGLYSTPRDMAAYVKWQLDEKDPVIALAHAPIQGDAINGKALVWNLDTVNGSRELSHGGGTFGMSSQVVLFPDSQQGYVLLANDACKGTEDALRNLAISLYQASRVNKRPDAGMSTH
ncbi:beta-lactamase [Acidisarcina polymorpha]|uniref:Beta-lactamase n=1 Tax=Acidisarcina polymorpha TaxID=2211140 RepID=A0A2Z5FU15_9BACT|nr:serine hydrolase [Acidisarcina polymorpha]AXC09984.1 beta-lactamase [Acidisarcina polymorpha]